MSTFIYIDDLHKGNDKPLFLDETQGFVISDPGVPTGRETRDQWLKRTVGCRPTRHKFMVQRHIHCVQYMVYPCLHTEVRFGTQAWGSICCPCRQ